MSSFLPNSAIMRRTPSVDAINRCREALASSPAAPPPGTDALSQEVPSRVRRTIDLFLSGPSAVETARQATRLLLRNVELQGPSAAIQTVQRGIEQSITRKDPHFGPLRVLQEESGELEAGRSGQTAMVEFMSTSLLASGLLPEETVAAMVATMKFAVQAVPSDIISVLKLRENLTNKEIIARISNPNRRVMMAGNVTFANLMKEHALLLQNCMNALLTRMNNGGEESQVAHGMPAAGQENYAATNEVYSNLEIEPLPAGSSSMSDETFACLIDAMGGKRLIASSIFELVGIGQGVEESRQDQFATDYVNFIGPVLREAYANFDAEAHARFIEQYPEYNQAVAKLPQILKGVKEETTQVLQRLILQKLSQYQIF